MTFNGVIIAPNSIVLEADYLTAVEGKPINVCRISFYTFGQNWLILQRGHSAIAELLV